MRLIGIDPGLRITGFGVIDVQGDHLKYVVCGAIKTEPQAPLFERIKGIFEDLTEVIQTYQPEQASIEKVFVNVNPQSTLLLGQARGAAISALVHHQLVVHEYTALQVKQSVVGYGKAKKEQVQLMVKNLLRLSSEPSADAADALAAAICHAHAARMTKALGQAAPSLQLRGTRVRKGRLVA